MIEELQSIVEEIQARTGLTTRQIFEHEGQTYVPLSIFSDRQFGVLEAVVKYLVENKSMGYIGIARLLNRDTRMIWVTYHNAKSKSIYIFRELPGCMVPAGIFSDRSKSPMQALKSYCREMGIRWKR